MGRRKIAPSLMCADFISLGKDLDLFSETGIEYLHIDIMDGHYVPNFTLGIDFCRTVSGHSPIPLDIHLMIENVDDRAPDFARIPGVIVSFHPEVCYHPCRTLQLIRSFGARAGIAVDPAVPIESLKHLLPEVDLVCIMMVNPGYAGQKLIPWTLGKLAEAAAFIKRMQPAAEIEVDGNVSWENIPKILGAGAEILVAGSSSLFEKGGDLKANILRLRKMLAEAG